MRTKISFIMVITTLFNVIWVILGQNPNCDFYQNMVLGQEYYIFNLEYPNFYSPGTTCRWVGESPPGSTIIISCEEINLPNSVNCDSDRLAFSLTGDTSFGDALKFCGRTATTLLTEDNSIAVGLFTAFNSPGGRFSCALTAIQREPITTTEGPVTCDCGWKHETRIVGGHDTGINEYPSMAAIIDGLTTDAFCGASIISDRYALTAAHCVYNRQARELGLLVGDYNLTSGTDTDAAALYRLSTLIQHPSYNPDTKQNDIAVVKTTLQIKFSMVVGPICLPYRYSSVDFYTQIVTALGWGFLDFGGPKSDTLQEVDLSIISNSDCAAAIPNDLISAKQICTYAPNKDTCLSDSGGPLLWQDPSTRRLQLVGIISYGLGCATTMPAVNTRVTSYLSWITSVTRDAVYCIK